MSTSFKFKLVLLICLIAFINSCNKIKNTKNSQQCPNQVDGKIIDMSGLDGCRWMIQLNDGSKINPINLEDFGVTLKTNNNIKISYKENKDMMTACMAGKIITILCIYDSE